MVVGCRTCLCIISGPSEGFNINHINSEADEISLKDKLLDCIPELLLEPVESAVLCHSCVRSLILVYEFKQNCLETQQKIYGYLQQMPLNTEMDTGEIALYYKRMQMIAEGGKPVVIKYNPGQELESQINAGIAAPTEKTPHICGLCKFSCVDLCTFRQHVILHKTTTPYKCDECTLMLPTPELLMDHLAMHTGEKPYSCTQCDFLASTHFQLKEHGGIHRKPFQCTVCQSRFAQKSELNMHSEIHNVLQQQNLEFHIFGVNNGSTSKQASIQTNTPDVKASGTHRTSDQQRNIDKNRTSSLQMTNQDSAQIQPETQSKVGGKKRKRRQILRQKIRVLVAPNTFMKMRKRDAIKLGFVTPEETAISSSLQQRS